MRSLLTALVLAVAVLVGYIVGTTTASSCYVDHSASGAIAFMRIPGNHPRALDEDGVVWEVEEGYGWRPDYSVPPLPVPVSEVKFWQWDALITWDNHIWRVSGVEWVDGGAWPGGASPVEATSWGKLKAEFSE